MERALSFGSVAETYDAFRPALPREVAAWFGVTRGAVVVDVAAGTGLATRTFAGEGATVISVEPDDEMRRVLVQKSPEVIARKGTGEALPVDDDSADLVAIISAWHWLNPAAAFAEAARVLHDGGTLGIAWNGADRREAWVSDLFALRRGEDGRARAMNALRAHSTAAIELPSTAPFHEVARTEIHWSWRRSVEEVVAWMGTYSELIVAEEAIANAARDATRAYAQARADADGRITIPMSSRCWKANRTRR